MADNEPNKSKKSYNGVAPLDVSQMDLRRQEKIIELGHDPEYEKNLKLILAQQEAINKLKSERLASTPPNSLESTIEAQRLKNVSNLANQEAAYMYPLHRQLGGEISTHTKYANINKTTTTMSGSQQFASMIEKNPELLHLPSEMVERQIGSGLHKIQSIGGELSYRMKNLGAGEMPEDMIRSGEEINEISQDVALKKRLRKIQSRKGMSTEKRVESAEESIASGEAYFQRKELSQRVSGGKFDLKAEEEKFSEALKKLTLSFDNLKEATDALEEGQISYDQYLAASKRQQVAQKEKETQEALVKEIKRQGVGGGDTGWKAYEYAGGIGRTASNVYKSVAIQDPITDMRQMAQFAARGVNQYNMGQSALGGDMHSLLQLEAQGLVTQFAGTMGNRQVAADVIDSAAIGLDVAAAKGKMAANLSDLPKKGLLDRGGFAQSMEAGGSELVGRVGAGIQHAGRVAREINTGETILNAGAAGDEYVRNITAVPAVARQALFDQFMSANKASIGSGSSASGIQATLTDKFMLDKAADLGMMPQQFAQLTGMANQVVGGSESKTTIAMRAGAAEQKKLLSAEQYISNLGSLSAVGGKSQDLEEILKTAVATGMDNSKNIAQMVQATTTLSQDMAKVGVGGTAATDSMMGAALERLKNLGVDENLRTSMIMSTAQTQNQLSSSMGLDIGSIAENEAYRKAGLSAGERTVMASMNITELNSIIQAKDPQAVADRYRLGDAYSRLGKEGFLELAKTKEQKIEYGMDMHVIGSGLSDKEKDRMKFGLYRYQQEAELRVGEVGGKKDIDTKLTAADQLGIAQAKKASGDFATAGGDDPAKAMQAIVEQLKEVAKALDTEKFQQKIVESVNTKEALAPLTQAGKDLLKGTKAFSDFFYNRGTDDLRKKIVDPVLSGNLQNNGGKQKTEKR